MEEIIFNCRFITPAFLGGANPKGTPELRAPSIKGALRFWWRAQCGIADLNELKIKESEIFGGVESNLASKSSFVIRVKHEDFLTETKLPQSMTPVKDKTFKVNIFEYLAYGTFDFVKGKGNVPNRSFIKPEQNFRVTLSFYKPQFKDEICSAFRILSLFGGIGNRSRNGFGKFIIDNDSTSSWITLLQSLKQGERKSFNSFSKNIICFQSKNTYERPEQALAEIGKAYKNAREYIDKKHNFTHRSYISSPIVDNRKQTTFLDRHSKPYFLCPVPENSQYRGIILFLPYLFLEDADKTLKEIYNLKSKQPNGFWDLKEILLNTKVSKHQEYYLESNGIFHDELSHKENPSALVNLKI